jgi:hypothetical protein
MAGNTPIADVPDAPTIGAATNVGTSRAYNNGSATVAYTAAATGGAVTTFTATSTPGSYTATGSSPITVTGLQSATSYTFTVSAANSSGTLTSASSSSITATTIPQVPTIGTATVDTGQSYTGSANTSVAFTPGATGGASATYTVTSSSGNTGTGSSSPISVSETVGNPTSTARTYTVTATNANGTTAASSASNSATPVSVPQAPTIGAATAGNASATVAYTANATGGAAVTTYTATSSPGGLTGTGASPITVSGLTNGTAYTFTVTATNSAGTSAASSASSSATPVQPAFYAVAAKSGSVQGKDSVVDASNNVLELSTGGQSVVFTYNATGTLQSQKQLMNASGGLVVNAGGWRAIARASSGNIYAVGSSNTTANGFPALGKYNSSLTSTWAYRTDLSNGLGGEYWRVVVDSSENVYAGGYRASGGAIQPLVSKYNSSGTHQWTRTLYGNENGYYGVGVDSGGNVWTCADYQSSSGVAYLQKFNSSGVSQICNSITWYTNPSSYFNSVMDVIVDSSDNAYIWVYNASQQSTLMKFNSSGTLQWQSYVSGNPSFYCYKMALDSSGNIYAAGTTTGTTGNILKYNSSGTLQFQRSMSGNFAAKGITISGSDMIITGTFQSINGTFTLKVPTDGSKTGTYTADSITMVYAASSLSSGSGSQQVGTILAANAAGTSITPTLTSFTPIEATPTYTSVTATI